MIDLWMALGFPRWPLVFSLAAVLVLGLWSWAKLFRSGASPDLHTKAWVDAILFWGAFAAITGVLGTLIGVIITAQYIEAAGGASAALIWGGFRVAMLSSAFGLLILTLASVIWFVLQLRWRILAANRTDAPA